MAYRKEIALEICELIKNAPKGHSEYVLEHFDQQDVADTVNRLRFEYPDEVLEETRIYMTNTAPISINK
ncbi:hypothetical protein NSQ14_11990 [Caldifermentibacillus hisashii]|uniref:hypothetical protein n=1 Tax=Caldifermentibacillus hisashii TaxID=996558 RepID=UPI0031B6D7F9